MKLKTWHIEGLAIATSLVGALVAFGRASDWREWVAALGVQLGFHHASVADRLRETEERRAYAELKRTLEAGPWDTHVECVGWLQRYWVGKELAWVVYFLATGAVSALVGCAVFLAHPFWRRWYRAWQARTTPNRPPRNLSPLMLMLKHRAMCTYAQAVMDALPDANGRRDPGAVAWLEVMRAYVESFDTPKEAA